MDETIKSNLALHIAHLSLELATVKAERDAYKAQLDDTLQQNAELQQQLDEATAPK